MKIEIKTKFMQTALTAFLSLGALTYGCMFMTYVLWFLGVID